MEWQLASTDLGSVRRWLADHGTIDGLVLEPRSTLQIFDTYLDTDDWRFHRAGFALRIRSESGKSEATLKSLHSTSAEVADRRELSETLENSESGSIRQSIGPVGTRVHAVSGARALLPLFEVRTSRQRFAIRKADESQQLGEIALDDTVISRPHGEPQTSMQRVEVEALAASHEPLQLLVKTLRNDCALEAASDSKYSQGLKSVGLAPGRARQFAPTAVDASMNIADVALANLRRYWSAWHLHEPGARLGDDPEELHDLRVAARRADAILREFRSALPARIVRIRPTLKKILRALGNTRDLDVALSELESFIRKLPESDRDSAEPLKQHLAAERSRARARMLSVLDSASVQTHLKNLTSLLAVRPGVADAVFAAARAGCRAGIHSAAIPEGSQGRGPPHVGFPDGGVSRSPRPREEIALRAGSGGGHLRQTRRWDAARAVPVAGEAGSAAGCDRREPSPEGSRGGTPQGYSTRDIVLDGTVGGTLCRRRIAGAEAACKGLWKGSKKMEATAHDPRVFGRERGTRASSLRPMKRWNY